VSPGCARAQTNEKKLQASLKAAEGYGGIQSLIEQFEALRKSDAVRTPRSLACVRARVVRRGRAS
jgi:hypothetical protein